MKYSLETIILEFKDKTEDRSHGDLLTNIIYDFYNDFIVAAERFKDDEESFATALAWIMCALSAWKHTNDITHLLDDYISNLVVSKDYKNYLRTLFIGIRDSSIDAFYKAVKIKPEYSIAYLFVFMYESFYFLNRIDYYKVDADVYYYHYEKLTDDFKKYAHGEKIHEVEDEHFHCLLPFIEYCDTNTDLVRWTQRIQENTLRSFKYHVDNNPDLYKKINSNNYHQMVKFLLKSKYHQCYYLPKKTSYYREALLVLFGIVDEQTLLRKRRYGILEPYVNVFVYKTDRKGFDYLYNLHLKNKDLRNAICERDEAIAAKEIMIRDFSHTYKNLDNSGLLAVANALIEFDDNEIKKYGRQVMLAYYENQHRKKDVEILRLRFDNKSEAVLKAVQGSISLNIPQKKKTIDIINEAIRRFIVFLVYNGSSQARNVRKICFKGYDLKEIRQSFEDSILNSETADVAEWFSDKIAELNLSISGKWLDLSYDEDGYAFVLLADLFTELIKNAMKYADKTETIDLHLFENNDTLSVEMKNKQVDDIENIPSSNTGLNSQRDILTDINKVLGYTGETMTWNLDGNDFDVTINISNRMYKG